MWYKLYTKCQKSEKWSESNEIDEVATNLNLEVTILPINLFVFNWFFNLISILIVKNIGYQVRIQVIF